MKNIKTHSIAFLTIIFFLFIAFGSGESEPKKPEEMKTEAYVMAQNFMKKNLKSPSTADFPFSEYKFEYLGDSKMKVISYVDAQNGFGAQIRTYYEATMKFNGGDWADINNWTLINLKTE